MEVTSIESKPLDASLFAFPADWAKQDMSGMQDRMKAMREQKGRDGEDFSKVMGQMKKRKAASSHAGEALGENAEAQTDMKDMMKQFGEMMKKQQPQSRQ